MENISGTLEVLEKTLWRVNEEHFYRKALNDIFLY